MTVDLLRAYDDEVRAVSPEVGPGSTLDQDGPVFRTVGPDGAGMIEYRDLGGLQAAGLDALIARQVAFFAARGREFEWKTHAHDAPADLTARLLAAGFDPADRETVVVGLAAPLAAAPRLPAGVRLREVTAEADLRRIADLSGLVYGGDHSRRVGRLAEEIAIGAVVVVAEAGPDLLCSGRIRFGPGRFGSLWGGATHPNWRGRGIYRALVAYRAQLAVQRGHEFLQVDCTEDSRPILERLGMSSVTTTTPYMWRPKP
ncbi:MAG TPA: GNAT family N-acetyltransferase [Actinocrinis sp.]|nr:GNAT family N-acetyltransferase [Actinocrinis sp.]